MVHVAVVIIQQVEFQFLGPGCTIVEGQRIEIACSIYTEGAEPAVSSVAVEIPELNVLVFFLGYKAGGGQPAAIFFPEHWAGEKAAIEFVRQAQGLLVGQRIRMT